MTQAGGPSLEGRDSGKARLESLPYSYMEVILTYGVMF